MVLIIGLSLLATLPDAGAEEVDWVTEGQMPATRSSFASAELPDGRIFVGLGYSSEYLDDAWVFDPTDMSWTEVTSAPITLGIMATASLGDKVYMFGGYSTTLPGHISTVLIYDVSEDEWSYGEDLPLTGSFMQAVAMDEHRILVVGGQTADYQACNIYDDRTGMFTPAEDLPAGRAGGTMVRTSDTVFYLGGWNEGTTVQDDIFGYSINGDYWWYAGALHLALVGMTGTMGSDGLLYLLGGGTISSWAGANVMEAVAWDPLTGNIIDLPMLEEPLRNGVAYELDDGRLMYFGGHDVWTCNASVRSIQIWEFESELTSESVDQGESAWLSIRLQTNFLDMEEWYGTVFLTAGGAIYGWIDIHVMGTMVYAELPISQSLPAGTYSVEIRDVGGSVLQTFQIEPLSLTVADVPSLSERLDDLEQQNQDLMDELNDTRAELADVKEAADAKLDAMIGYIILILVLATLAVAVIVLVRKK